MQPSHLANPENGRYQHQQQGSQGAAQPTNTELQRLLDQGAVWPARQAGHGDSGQAETLASGYPELDQQLVGGGWQPGNLVELLYAETGCGELRLLLPLLARLSRNDRWLIWVDPPHIPYAPALAAAGIDTGKILMVHTRNRQDRLWTLEQALKSGASSAVLGWLPASPGKAIRRLQVAAAESGSLGFLFRPQHCRQQSSCAPYRLCLEPRSAGVGVSLLKRKQGWAMPTQVLSLGEEQLLPIAMTTQALSSVPVKSTQRTPKQRSQPRLQRIK